MKLQEINKLFFNKLTGIYPEGEINSVFNILAEHYLRCSKKDLLLLRDEKINSEVTGKFFSALDELKNHKPVQYIIEETEFYGLKLKVNEHVLIPRPETEELVDWILKEDRSQKPEHRILDIGTGSGCIAIALKKNLINADVSAMDISERALELAKENAEKNKTDINFFHGDIINNQYSIINTQYSIMVSNPPYVRISEKEKIQKNVLGYEPHSALFVPDENPLLYYESIVNFAKDHLKKSGFIYFEINQELGGEIKQLLISNNYADVILKKDLNNKDRMIRGKKSQ